MKCFCRVFPAAATHITAPTQSALLSVTPGAKNNRVTWILQCYPIGTSHWKLQKSIQVPTVAVLCQLADMRSNTIFVSFLQFWRSLEKKPTYSWQSQQISTFGGEVLKFPWSHRPIPKRRVRSSILRRGHDFEGTGIHFSFVRSELLPTWSWMQMQIADTWTKGQKPLCLKVETWNSFILNNTRIPVCIPLL
jgi:hypothetical protein